MEIFEDEVFEDLCVFRGDPIDLVTGDEANVGHSDHHALVLSNLNDTRPSDFLFIILEEVLQFLLEEEIYHMDYLHVSRQDLLHQVHGPLLQELCAH